MKPLALAFLFLFAAVAARAAERLAFPATIAAGEVELPKRAEHRYAAFRIAPVFDIALYAETDQRALYPFSESDPIALAFRYHRRIDRADLIAAADRALAELLTPEQKLRFADSIDTLNAAYRDVAKGDHYALVYRPGKGTLLLRNAEPQATIPGHAFAVAYFGIWLGEHSTNTRLRKALIAQ